MRLTNVTMMALPHGRMRVLDLPVVEPAGPALPVSLDQGRHVGAGDRPGSWMAIAFRLPAPVEPAALAAAWQAVVARHGTLRTAFDRDAGGAVTLHEVALGTPRWSEVAVPGAARDALRGVLDEACRPFGRPSHRLVLVEPEDPEDPRPAVVIGADHAHTDLWSMAVLTHDLLAALDDPAAGLPPAPPFAEHTALLAAAPPPPEGIVERWDEIIAAEGGRMPSFPLPLGDVSTPRAEIVEVRDLLDRAGLARFDAAAAAAGVRTLALALSLLAGATRELADAPLRAVFPIHSRVEPRWHDAVGWFVTNSVLEIEDPSPSGAAAAFREALRVGSIPLAPVFARYGGMPQGPGMFAISWLDTRRLPVAIPADAAAQYVSAAIRTDGVMVWFVANGTGLHLRCRYPDTPEARASLRAWLDAAAEGFAETAA